jgi:PKD repeat protein
LSFEVYVLPISTFTYTSICVNELVTFNSDSIVPSSSYAWTFGNSQNGSAPIDTTTYTSSGSYTASLTVTDANLCSSTTNQTIAVQALPIASFNAPSVCLGDTTFFFNSSTGNSLSSTWDFGDSSPLITSTDAEHLYATADSLNVLLTVTDLNGCSANSTNIVVVNALPIDNLSDISTCGSTYPLNAFNSGSSYLWSPTNEITQSILATANGLYTVTITNSFGCQLIDSSEVTLNSIVAPNLGTDGAACGEIELNAGYPGSQFNWNITTADSTNQSIVVTNTGVYSVTVTDLNGCIGTDSITITAVYPFANPNLGPDQQICESNFPLVLNPGTYSNYLWSDNSSSSTFSLNTTNNVWVYVTDANGCSAYDTISIVSLNSPESELVSTITACDNTTLVASNSLIYEYLWNSGQIANLINVSTTGIYSVEITDPATACSVFDTISVTINQTPIVDLGNDISVCANLGAVLDAGNTGSSYVWTSTSGAILSNNQSLQTTSSDFYTVVVTNNGCSDSSTIYVDLLPAPSIPSDQAYLRYICGSTPVILEGSIFGDNVWTSSNGFTSTNDNVSVYETGNYYVTASTFGCSVSDTFELALSPQQIQAYYLVDTDTNTNLSLKFIDLSSPTPISYFWNFGDGTYDTVPNPVHIYPIIDTFYTSLTVSNGVCISTYNKMVNAKNFVIETQGPVAFLEQVDYSLYPNPVTSILNYQYVLNDEASTEVILYDMTGKIVKYVGQIENERSASFEIDTYDLMPGVYYLGMKAQSLKGNIKQTLKIIKL